MFKGMGDAEWDLIKTALYRPEKRSRGMPPEDFLILDLVHREESIPQKWQPHVKHLIEAGILEKYSRGRGVRYLFSRAYYDFIGKSGAYTRKRGLDRDTNKELLLKHIRDSASKGARFQDLTQVLPMLTRRQIQKLLDELRFLKLIDKEGATRSALWYPASIAPQ